ncbi:MAG: MBL fold metallo-hydrolase, partial [Pseudomonadota bacterium]
PIADDDRASSGYLVWVDGKARAMIDAGNGSLLRFAEAGARFEDLDFVGLSHFHTDHSSDFPALLKSGNFSPRRRALRVAGPAGSARFPSLDNYLEGLLNPETGIYRYLAGYLDGSRGLVKLEPRTVSGDEPERVLERGSAGLIVDALPVPHGIVPAVAFRVSIDSRVIVFGSDQTLSNPAYVDFAKNADLLIAHMVIPEGATGRSTELHATPSAIGRTAKAIGAETLLLSHFMARSLRDLDGNVAAVRDRYAGRIVLASDLECLPVGGGD